MRWQQTSIRAPLYADTATLASSDTAMHHANADIACLLCVHASNERYRAAPSWAAKV